MLRSGSTDNRIAVVQSWLLPMLPAVLTAAEENHKFLFKSSRPVLFYTSGLKIDTQREML